MLARWSLSSEYSSNGHQILLVSEPMSALLTTLSDGQMRTGSVVSVFNNLLKVVKYLMTLNADEQIDSNQKVLVYEI